MIDEKKMLKYADEVIKRDRDAYSPFDGGRQRMSATELVQLLKDKIESGEFDPDIDTPEPLPPDDVLGPLMEKFYPGLIIVDCGKDISEKK